MNNSRNFNEIFRKNVIFDDIKIRKKSGLHPLSRQQIFGKNHKGDVKFTRCSLFRAKAKTCYKKLLWKAMKRKLV